MLRGLLFKKNAAHIFCNTRGFALMAESQPCRYSAQQHARLCDVNYLSLSRFMHHFRPTDYCIVGQNRTEQTRVNISEHGQDSTRAGSRRKKRKGEKSEPNRKDLRHAEEQLHDMLHSSRGERNLPALLSQ